MEREKLALLKTHDGTLKELSDLRVRNEQTAATALELESLKRGLAAYAGRFEKLTEYNTRSVEELLAGGDCSLDCRHR